MSAERIRKEMLEAAYARLRETIAAKDVSAENLRTAALDALDKARVQTELEPQWVAGELDRLRLSERPEPPSEDPTTK